MVEGRSYLALKKETCPSASKERLPFLCASAFSMELVVLRAFSDYESMANTIGQFLAHESCAPDLVGIEKTVNLNHRDTASAVAHSVQYQDSTAQLWLVFCLTQSSKR